MKKNPKLRLLVNTDLITEEDVRLKFVFELFRLLGYKDNYSESELAIYGTIGRRKEPPKYADLAYFNDPNYIHNKKDKDWVENHTLVIVEIKKPDVDLDKYIDQAISYAIFSRAPIVVLTNGIKICIMIYDGYNKFKEIKQFLRKDLIQEWGEVKRLLAYSRVRDLKRNDVNNINLSNIDYSQYVITLSDRLSEEIKNSIGFYIPRFLTSVSSISRFRSELKKSGEEGQLISAEMASIDNNHLIILGDPGSGKSCLLNHLALETIADSHSIPIIIKAKFWGFAFNTILEAIESELKPCIAGIDEDIIADELRSNKYAILIDGYDEIRNSKEIFESEIASLSNNNNNKIILTSRKASYHEELSNFSAFEMKELNNSQIDDYAKNIKSLDHFSYHLFEQNLLDLARLPLYLFMLCNMAEGNTNMEMAKNRAILHDRFASYLLEDYLFKRIPGYQPKYSLQLKMQFLSCLAERKTCEPLFSDYTQCTTGLNNFHDITALLQEILESGILTGSCSSFDFIHPAIREFFYARLIKSFSSDKIISFLEGFHENEAYFDIILFLAGIPKEKDKQKAILDYLELNDLQLYIKCLEARYVDLENTKDYSKFEYNYLFQLQCSYNLLLDKYFNAIKKNFTPYLSIHPDQKSNIKDQKVQVIGYIDVPNQRIRYGYQLIKSSEDFKPIIRSKSSFKIKSEFFYREMSIPGLDLDSARILATDDIRDQLTRSLRFKLLDHPIEVECEMIVASIKRIASTARMFQDKSLEPLWKFNYGLYDARVYYDTLKSMRYHRFIHVGINNPRWPLNIEHILVSLDELINRDISLTEVVLPPYYCRESSPHLGEEMEKRLINRLNVMYNILPRLYSDMVDSNIPNLRKYMGYASICPFRCIVRYHLGVDFSKKGIIRCPLGEASIYFMPHPKGEILPAEVVCADPDINEEDQIRLRSEYINALKSLGRYTKNGYFRIFLPSVMEIIDDLALTNALYELFYKDLEWFIEDRSDISYIGFQI
ncbi:MAG: type I restriction enzyme HsdR N-terminal domain-containing protein [Methanothrix sp.]|nr:type I restriction enzyme HsdR N-terminal domain-containing protein [Methanothrix sp.]